VRKGHRPQLWESCGFQSIFASFYLAPLSPPSAAKNSPDPKRRFSTCPFLRFGLDLTNEPALH